MPAQPSRARDHPARLLVWWLNRGLRMRAIFISYRRERAIFMVLRGIAFGRDIRRVIDELVATCGVLLAIIGQDWVTVQDGSGRRRLEDPCDFIRLETASALKRDIPVIPVLVQGANMPRADQLPQDLTDFAHRNRITAYADVTNWCSIAPPPQTVSADKAPPRRSPPATPSDEQVGAVCLLEQGGAGRTAALRPPPLRSASGRAAATVARAAAPTAPALPGSD